MPASTALPCHNPSQRQNGMIATLAWTYGVYCSRFQGYTGYTHYNAGPRFLRLAWLLQSNLANYGATLLYNPGPDCAFAQDQLFLWRTLSQPVSLQSGPQGRLNQAHPAGSEQERRKCAVVLFLLSMFRKCLFCSWSFCFGV